MATADKTATPIQDVRIADRELWGQGPPLEEFRRLRGQCPVHWSAGMSDYPEEPGFWSVTTQEGVHAVSRDWQTYSSEIGGVIAHPAEVFPPPGHPGEVLRGG